MESYRGFAGVYDEFMDATPYEEWCSRLVDIIKKYGVTKPASQMEAEGLGEEELALLSERNLVLDLGCGTGTLTEMMAEAGYDMMGIDMSYDMLQVAMDKRAESGHDIMYLCQDMR